MKRKVTVGEYEVRARFEQGRAVGIGFRVAAAQARLDKMAARLWTLKEKQHKHREAAAGLNGIVPHMRKNGFTHARPERDGTLTMFPPIGVEVK